MEQAWLSVIGLTLDILGFSCILIEWWRGIKRERLEAIIADNEVLAGIVIQAWRGPVEARDIAEGAERYERARGDIKQLGDQISDEVRFRKWVFLIGASLIFVGFSLQILGNAPGCCPSLSFHPTSNSETIINKPTITYEARRAISRRYQHLWPRVSR